MVREMMSQTDSVQNTGLTQIKSLDLDDRVFSNFIDRMKSLLGDNIAEDTLYIPIEQERIPYRFDVKLGDKTFSLECHYNSEYDMFTLDFHRHGVDLAVGERLVYNHPLFASFKDNTLPDVHIIPTDVMDRKRSVTPDTLGSDVHLFVFGYDADE